MNNEVGYICEEINRFVLLLRNETDVEKKQEYLNKINAAVAELDRLWPAETE